MAPQSTRGTGAHPADQIAADVRRFVEQMTADARKEMAQLFADARKSIDQAAAVLAKSDKRSPKKWRRKWPGRWLVGNLTVIPRPDIDRCSRRSLEVHLETLMDAVQSTTDILQQRTTTLPAKHRVKSGDTLSAIAIRYYGGATEPQWRKIYDANKEVIGGDPQAIRPGDPIRAGATLNIPA